MLNPVRFSLVYIVHLFENLRLHNRNVKTLRLSATYDTQNDFEHYMMLINCMLNKVGFNDTLNVLDLSDFRFYNVKPPQFDVSGLKSNKHLTKIIDDRGTFVDSILDIFQENCSLMNYESFAKTTNLKLMLNRNRMMRKQIESVVVFVLWFGKTKAIVLDKDTASIVAKLLWESRFNMNEWNY